MSRKVHKLTRLQSATFVDKGPFSSEPRLKGAALEGIRYQARVHTEARELGGLNHSEQWIQFRDAGRIYHCRPDDIVDQHDRIVVIESKLSLRQLKKGLAQLRLYKSVLEHIFNKPVVCVLAFKHWILGSDGCLPMLDELPAALYTPIPQLRRVHGWNFM